MSDIRKPAPAPKNNLPLAIVIGSVVIAGALALTRNTEPPKDVTPVAEAAPMAAPLPATTEALPPGHPAVGATQAAPGVHAGDPAAMGGMGGMGALGGGQPAVPGVAWTVPPRWQLAPSTSTMRIATYKIPRAAGDTEDAELSVIRAGGDTDSNIDRWLGQFDEVGRKSAKRSEKTIGGLKVSMVEIQGAYSGMAAEPQQGFAMLSAIVDTPETKHFFKMTGPAKTVQAAHAEFDALVDSIKPLAAP